MERPSDTSAALENASASCLDLDFDANTPDVDDLKKLYHRAVAELHSKRSLLYETRGELGEAVAKQHELERALEDERRKTAELQTQLELACATARRWEEERTSAKENMARQKVDMDGAMRERDVLKEQLRTNRVRIMNLERREEDLLGQLTSHDALHASTQAQMGKCREAMHKLNSIIQKIESDKKTIEKKVETTIAVSSKIQTFYDRSKTAQKKLETEKHDILNELAVISAELNVYKRMHESKSQIEETATDEHISITALTKTIGELEKRLAEEITKVDGLNKLLEFSNKTEESLTGIKKTHEAKVTE